MQVFLRAATMVVLTIIQGSLVGPIGLARVDDITYQWLGDWIDQPEAKGINLVNLTSIQLTPTRTICQIQAGPMNLIVTYLSPIEVSGMMLLPSFYVVTLVYSLPIGLKNRCHSPI